MSQIIQRGDFVYIGEQSLNVTGALNLDNTYHKPNNTKIGWWNSSKIGITSPAKILDLAERFDGNFNVTPQDFTRYAGNWYLVNQSSGYAMIPHVFTIIPSIPYGGFIVVC